MSLTIKNNFGTKAAWVLPVLRRRDWLEATWTSVAPPSISSCERGDISSE